jgi:hypothetical protein
MTRISDRTTYAAAVCRALDAQALLHGQAADAIAGKRALLPPERREVADAAWRDVLATRYVYASPALQEALSAFDRARAASSLALNARDEPSASLAMQRLTAARVTVLDALQATTNDVNDALGGQFLPLPVRVWLRLRRRPLHPPAPLPSEIAAEQNGI